MFRKRFSIGLDIGSDTLKCAVIDAEHGSLIESCKIATVEDRQARDQQAAQELLLPRLVEVIRRSQKDNPNVDKSINTSIQDGSSVTRYLELPPLKPKELSPAVSSQVMKILPFPLDKAILSFIQVPQLVKIENVKKTAVFFIAEQSDMVKDLKTRLVDSGCTINRIETPVLALSRIFAKNHSFPRDHFLALVHVGFTSTYVVVVRDKYPYFARDFALAGKDFTYAFQMSLIKTWSEAEEYKRSYDVLDREVGVEPFVTRWLEEVKKSLDFFTGQKAGKPLAIERVLLSGGSAHFKNLDMRLAEHLGIPVERDSWNRLKYKGKSAAPDDYCHFNIAMGLALEP
jgi:type IV pilus assembly protein PilM